MLWSPETLKGTPEDRQGVRQRRRNFLPPATPEKIPTPLAPEMQHVIRRVNPAGNQKVIALTFDLCETETGTSGYDAGIVNYLRQHSVRATFFAGGKWMLSHPEKSLQLMADPLFEIGNHSWSHANFRMIDPGRMQTQILWTQAQYAAFWETLQERSLAAGIDLSEMFKIPGSIRIFRFPYGTCNAQALEILKQSGLPVIQWDVVTGDPSRDRTPQAIAREVLQKSRPGSIVVCHANGRGYGTAEALPLFIPQLRAQGYAFLTVSELLTCGPAVSSKECYELTPGDNIRYDKAIGVKQDVNH
jgi:peptidoglycan/xylan/chitin deacetylase (PgdA/CDA1 family)